VIGWLLKLLLLFLLVRSLMLVVGGLLRGLFAIPQAGDPGRVPAGRAPQTRGRLVQDPVCGTYVSTALSVTRRINGELVHFCSPECRDKYHAA